MSDQPPRPTPEPASVPGEPRWSTEHYGFPDAPTPVTPPPAAATAPIPAHGVAGTAPADDLRSWWHRGRTLAAAGAAAAILAVGAVGFGVGHAAADGPDGPGVAGFDGFGGPRGGHDVRGDRDGR